MKHSFLISAFFLEKLWKVFLWTDWKFQKRQTCNNHRCVEWSQVLIREKQAVSGDKGSFSIPFPQSLTAEASNALSGVQTQEEVKPKKWGSVWGRQQRTWGKTVLLQDKTGVPRAASLSPMSRHPSPVLSRGPRCWAIKPTTSFQCLKKSVTSLWIHFFNWSFNQILFSLQPKQKFLNFMASCHP